MKTIGLVGGVASGKSLAAAILVDFGACLLDADRTGHAVLADDADVHQAVIDRWGDAVLLPDGKVDRAAVARRVFAESAAGAADRKFLEDLLHPRIRRRLNQDRDKAAVAGKPAVVLDAPLLLEADWGPMCDLVLMIDSPRELRLERAKTRGWTDAEFGRREAAQWTADEKRRLADVVIPNCGPDEELAVPLPISGPRISYGVPPNSPTGTRAGNAPQREAGSMVPLQDKPAAARRYLFFLLPTFAFPTPPLLAHNMPSEAPRGRPFAPAA